MDPMAMDLTRLLAPCCCCRACPFHQAFPPLSHECLWTGQLCGVLWAATHYLGTSDPCPHALPNSFWFISSDNPICFQV